MTQYEVTLTYDAPNESAAISKLTTCLFLGNLDVDGMTLKEVNEDGTKFDFPFVRRLVETKKAPNAF